MAKPKVIIPKTMEKIYDKFRYAPAVQVDNTIYVAGQVGRDEELRIIENPEAQFVQAFENVKTALAAAGATLDDLVEMVTFHTDMRHLRLFAQVKDRYLTNNYPTWTAIGTPALSMPGLLVEIKCTAVVQG